MLQAIETCPSVLLVDEVDRADDEFEAFLLEVLSDFSVSVPELGTIRADVPPVVVVTSNRTRDVHDALKRRCLYAWVEHPSFDREGGDPAAPVARVDAASRAERGRRGAGTARARAGEASRRRRVARLGARLLALGARELDRDTAAATLGVVLKYREDQDAVRARGVETLLVAASG